MLLSDCRPLLVLPLQVPSPTLLVPGSHSNWRGEKFWAVETEYSLPASLPAALKPWGWMPSTTCPLIYQLGFCFVFSLPSFPESSYPTSEVRGGGWECQAAITNLDSIFKSRDITLPTKVCLVKAMVFPVVMYGCESWTVKKAERWRIDAFELWCWRRLQPVHSKGDQSWVFFGRNDAEAETPVLWPPDAKSWLIGKDSDAGRDWGREEKGMTEDKMAGWHHGLDGCKLEWTLGVGDRQGDLACCSSWGHKESDTTERLNWTEPWHLWTWFYLLLFPQSLLHQLFPLFLKSSIIISLHWLLLPPATNILRYPSSSEKKYPTKASVSPSTIILFKLLLKGMLLFLDLHLTHQHNLILLPAPPPPHPFPWKLLWERSTMISSL